MFDYDSDTDDAVPFDAALTDVGGVIWGVTCEPNTFSTAALEQLDADISGIRSGLEVRFRKTYVGAPPGAEDAVDYFGRANADGSQIDGRWRVVSSLEQVSGPFVMNRRPSAEQDRLKRAKANASLDLGRLG